MLKKDKNFEEKIPETQVEEDISGCEEQVTMVELVQESIPKPVAEAMMPPPPIESVPSTQQGKSMNLMTIIIVLCTLIGLLVGLIGGYFVGFSRCEKQLSTFYMNGGSIIPSYNNSNVSDSNVGSVSSEDYSKYVINEKLDLTVENYYDDESKPHAAAVIGKEMPEVTWTTADGKEHSNKDFGSDAYILEVFVPDCTYCNASIEHVDNFRSSNEYEFIAVTNVDGDISAFNKPGENAFYISPSNELLDFFDEYAPWVPTFFYVEDGVVRFVYYGGVDEEILSQNEQIAFDR